MAYMPSDSHSDIYSYNFKMYSKLLIMNERMRRKLEHNLNTRQIQLLQYYFEKADEYTTPTMYQNVNQIAKRTAINDLMETGKFAYNANLVLLIYPKKWEDYDEEDEPILKLKYANCHHHF